MAESRALTDLEEVLALRRASVGKATARGIGGAEIRFRCSRATAAGAKVACKEAGVCVCRVCKEEYPRAAEALRSFGHEATPARTSLPTPLADRHREQAAGAELANRACTYPGSCPGVRSTGRSSVAGNPSPASASLCRGGQERRAGRARCRSPGAMRGTAVALRSRRCASGAREWQLSRAPPAIRSRPDTRPPTSAPRRIRRPPRNPRLHAAVLRSEVTALSFRQVLRRTALAAGDRPTREFLHCSFMRWPS